MSVARFSLSDHRLVQLKRSFKIILIADALLMLGTCLATVATMAQAPGVRGQLHAAQDELSRSLPPAPESKPSVEQKLVSKVSPVQATQDRLIQSASNHGCRLGGVETSSELVPYASPFILGVSPTGWNQITVRASVFGSIGSIVGTLHDLRTSGLPIELDSIDLSRQDISPHGDVTLQAQFVIIVLLASGGTS